MGFCGHALVSLILDASDLQVGQKLMPYLTLRAQAELDVVEKPLQASNRPQAYGGVDMRDRRCCT